MNNLEPSLTQDQVNCFFDNQMGSSKLESEKFEECEETLEFLREANKLVLRNMLSGYNPNEAGVFSVLVQRIVDEQGDLATLAGMLGVSVSTIHRWKSGNSTPHPLMRAAIKEHLQQQIVRNQPN